MYQGLNYNPSSVFFVNDTDNMDGSSSALLKTPTCELKGHEGKHKSGFFVGAFD